MIPAPTLNDTPTQLLANRDGTGDAMRGRRMTTFQLPPISEIVKAQQAEHPPLTCECVDPGCPCCHGKCESIGINTLFRVDMEDRTGTLMCDGCTSDAFESGLFATMENEDDDPDGNFHD